MWRELLDREALLRKAEELQRSGFHPGCDDMSAKSAGLWISVNGDRLLRSIFRGEYQPMPAVGFRTAKMNGSFRALTRLTALDTVLQKCLLDAVREDCERRFSPYSYAYRSGAGVQAALEQYCRYGSVYRFAAKTDPYNCFDNMDYSVLRSALQTFFDDAVLIDLLMRYARLPILEDGEAKERERGIPQGAPLSPLLCNIYMHSLDLLLTEREIPFIRYADDLVVFANELASLSACRELAEQHLCQSLKLTPNPKKAQRGAPFSIKYLGHSFVVGKDGILVVDQGESFSAAYHAWHAKQIRNPGRTVHILSDGILRQRDFSLLLDTAGEDAGIPIKNTDCINVFSNVIFDSGFLRAASQNGIIVNLFDQQGLLQGSFVPIRPLRSPKTTEAQLLAYYDDAHRLLLAKAFVLGSIHNLRLNIRQYNKAASAPEYLEALTRIKVLEVEIKACDSYEILLPLEAQVRSCYYSCYDSFILGNEFRYDRRSRRPPRNPFNAMLSFGNTVLYSYIATEINKTALDVRVGFLHATNAREQSLNLDIAELFKPLIVDRTVMTLINRRQIRADRHFTELENGGVYLNAEGKRLFLEELNEKLHVRITDHGTSMTYLELITAEVRKLVRHFRSGEKYKPFKQVR